MEKYIVDQFHFGLNQVTQPAKKDPRYADAAPNLILSSRNTPKKRGGSLKLSSSAYASGVEIKSIFDWDRHGGDLVHKYLFNAGDKIYELHEGGGVAGVIKSGLTTSIIGEFQYSRAGNTLYMGDGENMLKYYTLAEFTVSGDTTQLISATNERLSQSFIQAHLSTRKIASISLPLARIGTISAGINITVEIRPDSGGEPHASTITATSQTIAAEDISTGWGWIPFTFATLPSLTGNTLYWIVLRSSSALGGGEGTMSWAVDGDSSGAGYSSGDFGTYASATWTIDTNKDGLFAVFVEPDKWGITAPTVAPTLDLGSTTDGPKYNTAVDQDAEQEVTAETVGNLAQSFTTTKGMNLDTIDLYLRKQDTPVAMTGNLTVRIEEDLAGVPSGTLVGQESVSVTATSVGASLGFITFSFANAPVTLEKEKLYWIVLQGNANYDAVYVTGTGAGATNIRWGTDASSPTYADGTFATYSSSAWTKLTTSDGLFLTKLISRWTDGGRSYRVSFKNSVTGHISNPSPKTPASGNILSNVITVNNFPTTTDPQVDKIIIWATTDGGGIWFYLTEIDAPGAAYTDDSNDDEINFSREAPFDNAPPPNGFLIERVRNQIIVAGVDTNPRTAFYSGSLGQILEGVADESFPPLNFQSVPSGSERIYTLSEIDDIPVLFASDQLFSIYGQTAESFILRNTRGGEKIGSRSRKGAISTEMGIFFFSHDRKVYLIPTAEHIPQLISEVIEDSLEAISTDSSVFSQVSSEKARLEYINFGDMHWLMLAIPTGNSAINDSLYIYDLDLHAAHPGSAWMGPWTLTGTEPFQYLATITKPTGAKEIWVGDNAGFIRSLNTGNQDDGSNIVARYDTPFLDLGHPDLVKDAISLEIVIPASQTKPTISISIDTESNYETLTLTAVNEMERGASSHRYTAFINKHFTRIKIRSAFAAENATGELWQIALYWEPLFDMGGAINAA